MFEQPRRDLAHDFALPILLFAALGAMTWAVRGCSGFGAMNGLGLSLKNGLKGWANIYLGHEDYYDTILWRLIGPLMLFSLISLAAWIRSHPLPKDFRGDPLPRAYRLMWLVLIVQNVIAQLITGPLTSWNEAAFNIYYLILFFLSAVIIYHFHTVKTISESAGLFKSKPLK